MRICRYTGMYVHMMSVSLLSYLVQHLRHLGLESTDGVAAALLGGRHVIPPGLLGKVGSQEFL